MPPEGFEPSITGLKTSALTAKLRRQLIYFLIDLMYCIVRVYFRN